MDIIKFKHHDVEVYSFRHLQGKHREYCLCYQCENLHLENIEKNCKIASLLFQMDILCEITTPVFYCKEFKPINKE